MERHTILKLIGSPPGYVRYDERGQLAEGVQRMPYCLLLFNEFEKAHLDVFNMMLQILEGGRLTDFVSMAGLGASPFQWGGLNLCWLTGTRPS